MNRMEQGIASIPRQTMIRDQPHMLAYITPAEAMLLKQNGGSGLPSHGGVPEFGLWSSTFGDGNSFSQSVSNMTSGRDGAKYSGGEWQGDPSEEPTRTIQHGPLKGEKATIMGPTSFFDSNQNKPPEGWANYHGGVQDALYKEDDKPQPVFAQPMYRPPAPVNVAPPTLDPVSSGQPMVPMNADEQTTTSVTNPSDVIARPPVMPIGQRPANKAYTFQELLGMYQNPYA